MSNHHDFVHVALIPHEIPEHHAQNNHPAMIGTEGGVPSPARQRPVLMYLSVDKCPLTSSLLVLLLLRVEPAYALPHKLLDVALKLAALHGPGQRLLLPLRVGAPLLLNHLALDLPANRTTHTIRTKEGSDEES